MSILNDTIFQEEIVSVKSYIKSEIKKSIIVNASVEATHIFVIAFDKVDNKLTSIIYKERSTPIGGYAYDAKFGKYYVECYDYMDLGTIPISFSIKIDKINKWQCRIPVPEGIIKKYLDDRQASELEIFKKENKDRRLEFMQLAGCY